MEEQKCLIGACMSSFVPNLTLQDNVQPTSPLLKQKIREVVLQALYAWHVHPEGPDLVSLLMSQAAISKKNASYALSLTKQIVHETPQLDNFILNALKNVSFDKISIVEKLILRMMIFEHLHGQPSLDPAILTSEALRLTKKFSYKELCSFVYAVLHDIFQAQGASHQNAPCASC